MSFETEIRARLVANPSIFNLVGARIYPQALPQNPTYPAIIYNVEYAEPAQNLSGPTSVTFPSLALYMVAETYEVALALGAAVKNSLDGYIGVLTTLMVVVELDDEDDEYDDEIKKYAIRQTYAVSCRG